MSDSLLKSWGTEPFTDIIVVDVNETKMTDCPETHPDELIYEVWPGTRQMCDCLENDNLREFYLDVVCKGSGTKGNGGSVPQASDGCFDVQGHHPIVQNSINGIKVCGKRASG